MNRFTTSIVGIGLCSAALAHTPTRLADAAGAPAQQGLKLTLTLGTPIAARMPAPRTNNGEDFTANTSTGIAAINAIRPEQAPPHARGGMRLASLDRRTDLIARTEDSLSTAVPGVVRAQAEATLSSRMAGRISRMPLKDGDAFKRGDVLVELDCDKPRAEVRAAAAQVAIQARMLETNEELDSFSAIGKNELAISKAQHDKARAEHDALHAVLKDCAITAPFAGRVTEVVAHNHETIAVSQPLLKVFDMATLELDIIVPSTWLQWLKPGQSFDFVVEETGQTLAASVARMSARVDPVSKTVRVVGRFKQATQVLPGMSGQARFPANGV